jgi:predicted enzyme related to lactoylglutathione lyase
MASITRDPRVMELRLVVTATDYDEAVRFYRDVLGMPQGAAFTSGDGGQVVILDAGRATIEIANPAHADYVDEVEVGRRVAGHLRVALAVEDAAAATEQAERAGAEVVAPPTTTPWGSSNARLDAPGGLHITLFSQEVDPFEG